jgi:hypothetical protein
MNRHPHETATDDPLLQPAVFAVLQFRGLKRGNSCRTARTANCKWWYLFAGIHVIESIMNEYRFHLQKYRPGSKTVCPECGRKVLLYPLYRRGGRDFFPGVRGQMRPRQQLWLSLFPERILPGQSVSKENIGWP